MGNELPQHWIANGDSDSYVVFDEDKLQEAMRPSQQRLLELLSQYNSYVTQASFDQSLER